MQKWEYTVIARHRGMQFMDGTAGSWDKDSGTFLPQMGADGWELASVVPQSDRGGNAAGLTTSELWIFKRPSPSE